MQMALPTGWRYLKSTDEASLPFHYAWIDLGALQTPHLKPLINSEIGIISILQMRKTGAQSPMNLPKQVPANGIIRV